MKILILLLLASCQVFHEKETFEQNVTREEMREPMIRLMSRVERMDVELYSIKDKLALQEVGFTNIANNLCIKLMNDKRAKIEFWRSHTSARCKVEYVNKNKVSVFKVMDI